MELENSLRHAQRKIIIVKAATSGMRLMLEDAFQDQLQRFIRAWHVRLSRHLESVEYFKRAVTDARILKAKSTSISDLRRRVNTSFASDLDPLLEEFRRIIVTAPIEKYYVRWAPLVFSLGAVTTLNTFGVHARSPALETFLRVGVVSKASGGEDFTFELSDAAIIHALESRGIIVGAGLTHDIIEDARSLIRDKVYLGGSDVADIAEELASAHAIADWRALSIARTETQAAFNLASYRMFERSGVQKQFWVTVGDNRVRPQHVANEEAGAVQIGVPFPSGQLHPGDGPLSVNCRCSLLPDLSDPSILLNPWDGKSGPFLSTDAGATLPAVRRFSKRLSIPHGIAPGVSDARVDLADEELLFPEE